MDCQNPSLSTLTFEKPKGAEEGLRSCSFSRTSKMLRNSVESMPVKLGVPGKEFGIVSKFLVPKKLLYLLLFSRAVLLTK